MAQSISGSVADKAFNLNSKADNQTDIPTGLERDGGNRSTSACLVRKSFNASKDLRIGNPFPPFLFTLVVVVDMLGRMVDREKVVGLVDGFVIRRNNVSMSHSQFADDAIFFTLREKSKIDMNQRHSKTFVVVVSDPETHVGHAMCSNDTLTDPQQNDYMFVMCCLTLAWKMRTSTFKFLELMDEIEKFYTAVVLAMELDICKKFKWQMQSMTAIRFVEYFVPQVFYHRLVYQIIINSHADIGLTQYSAFTVAAVAVLIAVGPKEKISAKHLLALLAQLEDVKEKERAKACAQQETVNPKLEWRPRKRRKVGEMKIEEELPVMALVISKHSVRHLDNLKPYLMMLTWEAMKYGYSENVTVPVPDTYRVLREVERQWGEIRELELNLKSKRKSELLVSVILKL
ncbi:hypothetical protein HYC85_014188 [Camellia sinensis]|uniref:Cyclin C-terminal domain-containing protein n=1 Tax=Camellia sinensis TaxID=4442 RepID=A0A7J7H7M7_CAMSI|nr:hypothetical protein HYC85_014188 [Camellia sinensis]